MELILFNEDIKLSNNFTCIYFHSKSLNEFYHAKMKVMLNKLESKFKNTLFFSLDIDIITGTKERFSLKKLPTVIIFNKHTEIGRVEGLPLTQALTTFFKRKIQDG